jgi:transposase
MRREAGVPLIKRRPSDAPSSLAGKTRSAVRDVLERYPDAMLKELIERVEEEHGVTVGTSNMARIRKELLKAENSVAAACRATQ